MTVEKRTMYTKILITWPLPTNPRSHCTQQIANRPILEIMPSRSPSSLLSNPDRRMCIGPSIIRPCWTVFVAVDAIERPLRQIWKKVNFLLGMKINLKKYIIPVDQLPSDRSRKFRHQAKCSGRRENYIVRQNQAKIAQPVETAVVAEKIEIAYSWNKKKILIQRKLQKNLIITISPS